MTGGLPRFARKDVRAAAARLTAAGFAFDDVDSSGHAQFTHPSGVEVTLPGSPHPRGGWQRRVDKAIADATGQRRGKTRQRVKHLPHLDRPVDDGRTAASVDRLTRDWHSTRAAIDARDGDPLALCRRLLHIEDQLEALHQPPPAGRWSREL